MPTIDDPFNIIVELDMTEKTYTVPYDVWLVDTYYSMPTEELIDG